MNNSKTTLVSPGTANRFYGDRETALAAGYVEISEEEYLRRLEALPKKVKPSYEALVAAYVREKYNQSAVEAILANYLANPTDSEHRAEFNAFSVYRDECKRRAREAIRKYNG